jgi:hypothetical protein
LLLGHGHFIGAEGEIDIELLLVVLLGVGVTAVDEESIDVEAVYFLL